MLLLTEDNHRIYTDLMQFETCYGNLSDCLEDVCIPSHVDAAILLKNYEFTSFNKAGDTAKKDLTRLNRIKNFWGSSRSRLSKFKGLPGSTLMLHIKECEFRYNNRDKDLYDLLLRIFRNDPLF